jgi:hypothetical protein
MTPSAGVTYYYWVLSRNAAGVSSPGTPDTGSRSVTVPNYTFANRTVLTGTSVSASANNTVSSKEPGEPDHAGNRGGKSVWWSWTAPSVGTLTVNTVGSTFDTLLAVYTGSTVSVLNHIASNDDFGTGFNRTSRVTFGTVAGTTYHIAVDGFRADSGEVTLNLDFDTTPFATNDHFAARIPLFGSSLNVTANNQSASREPGEPLHGGTGQGKSLWWSWTAPASGTLYVDTFGSNFNTTLGIYNGSTLVTLGALAVNDDAGSGGVSQVIVPVTGGSVYQIAVDGYDGVFGTVALNIQLIVPSPAPTAPSSPSRIRGASLGANRVRLSWPSGTNTTHYLVEKKEPGSSRWVRVRIVGATNRNLTISGLGKDGVYQFRITAMQGGNRAPRPSKIVRIRVE